MRVFNQMAFAAIVKTVLPLLILMTTLTPQAAHAGAIQSLHKVLLNTTARTTEPQAPSVPAPKTPVTLPKTEIIPATDLSKPPVTLGVNNNGDMAVQHGDVSVVMAYSAPEDSVAPKDRVHAVQAKKPEVPTINGVSVKLNVVF